MKLYNYIFSGTGSVGRIVKELGYTIISLDLKNASINEDILKFDYNKFDNDFDVSWSSPPCTEYIIAKQTGTRKIDEANETVKKAIDIINYFDPNVFVENPPDRTFEGARVYEKLRFLMLIIVKMEWHTENAPDFGQI